MVMIVDLNFDQVRELGKIAEHGLPRSMWVL